MSWLPCRDVWVTSLNCLHWLRSRVSSSIRRSCRYIYIYIYYWICFDADHFTTQSFPSTIWPLHQSREGIDTVLARRLNCGNQLCFFEVVHMPGFTMVVLVQLSPKLGSAERGLLKCGCAWNGLPRGVCACVFTFRPVSARLKRSKILWMQEYKRVFVPHMVGGWWLWEITVFKNSYFLNFLNSTDDSLAKQRLYTSHIISKIMTAYVLMYFS